MACVLHAWELGAGYGHIVSIYAMAAALAGHGHRNLLAVKDVAAAARLAPEPDLEIYQAPLPMPTRSGSRPALNYADLLRLLGYTEPRGLAGLLKAWLRLFDHVRPDLVVLDHAPTAGLAARLAGLPGIAVQNGFCIPPSRSPFPSMQPWRDLTRGQLRPIDREVLGVINDAIALVGGRPLERLCDLFDLEGMLLATLPAFDHYGPRAGATYIGPIVASGSDRYEAWAAAPSPRVFAYFSQLRAAAARIVTTLAEVRIPTLLHVADPSFDPGSLSGRECIVVARGPVDALWASQHADFVACHGGHGTVCGAILNGAPVLLTPTDVEKALMGYRLAGQGLAVNVDPAATTEDARRAIQQVLDGRFREKAADIAARYRSTDMAAAPARVAQACDDVVRHART